MITQPTGLELHQQTKAFEEYLLVQTAIGKICTGELAENFLKNLESTYKVDGDLMEILRQAKSQTELN